MPLLPTGPNTTWRTELIFIFYGNYVMYNLLALHHRVDALKLDFFYLINVYVLKESGTFEKDIKTMLDIG